jgi:carbon monoxide dehydrogenase subunit G
MPTSTTWQTRLLHAFGRPQVGALATLWLVGAGLSMITGIHVFSIGDSTWIAFAAVALGLLLLTLGTLRRWLPVLVFDVVLSSAQLANALRSGWELLYLSSSAKADDIRGLGFDPVFGLLFSLAFSFCAFCVFLWVVYRFARSPRQEGPERNMAEVVASVLIQAPLEDVWAFNMDLTQIARFHPRTDTVTFLDGKTTREVGVAYQCNVVSGRGRGSCVEQVIDVQPMRQFTTALPSDTWGFSGNFADLKAVTTFHALDARQTKMTISVALEPKTLKGKLMLLVGSRKLRRQTQDTLDAIKVHVEQQVAQEKVHAHP